jgi:hypothetical protein
MPDTSQLDRQRTDNLESIAEHRIAIMVSQIANSASGRYWLRSGVW